MGHFYVPIEVGNRADPRLVALSALVDTGSTYTWIPRNILDDLGVEAQEERPFELANGQQVRYSLAWINVRMRGRTQPTIAVFGEAGAQPILGVVTLEEYGLAADPVNERLIPVPAFLKAAS